MEIVPGTDGRVSHFPVLEIFGPTVQGEGHVIGMRTAFVRLGGCDYRCTKCDSMHAVDPVSVHQNARRLSVEDIVQELVHLSRSSGGFEMVTLSGGNPLIYDLQELVRELTGHAFTIAVETQGSYWRDWIRECHFITISPKGPGMGERFEEKKFRDFILNLREHPQVAVKVVVFGPSDLDFAKHVEYVIGNTLGIHAHWPHLYLSLGNPKPPKLEELTSRIYHHNVTFMPLLLDHYKNVTEMILRDVDLVRWRVTPQLHVLLWANEKGR